MMFENNGNKKKKEENLNLGYGALDDTVLSGSVENGKGNPVDIYSGFEEMKRRTEQKMGRLSVPVDVQRSEQRFRNSFSNHMLPKDTPERHRRNYALSEEALDDVVGDYYNNTLKGTFDMKREEAKKKGREEYMSYVAVPGADPVTAFKASANADDPLRTIDETMDSVDDEYLIKQVAPLASYGGYDAKEYVDKFVKPSLREKMVKEYVDENTPKNSAEYIFNSSLNNSLVGKVGAIAMNGDKGVKNNRMVADSGLANYDANRLENFAAGVGGLLVDAPVFSGLGSLSRSAVGKGTAMAMDKISKSVLSRYSDRLVSKEFADAVARKVVVDRLKNRIIQGAATQGLTLGGYDVANSVADDILYNGSVDVGKAVGSFAKGFTTGAAVGAAGTAMTARAKGLTGGKKLLSSAGVLSAESAIFTAGAEFDKLTHGVEIEPVDLLKDFGESAATLLTMRMANWRPKGAGRKLDGNGNIKDGLKLSKSELQEMREANVNPEEFVSMLEKELRMPSLGSADAKLLKENYATLMADENLSAAAKSKLMYLVEDKITSTPPVVFDYEVRKNGNGTWSVKMLDPGGGVVERLRFRNAGNAKSHLMLQRGGIRKNRIAYYEKELTSGMESQNFLQEAGLYAKEKGIDADMLAEAMYKSARKENLSSEEQNIMNEITARSSYYESKINKSLLEARRSIEERYGLEKGTLAYAVDKKFIECSMAENRALDEYEAFVRSELEKTKGREYQNVPNDAGMERTSNEENKRREAEEYMIAMKNKHAGQGGTESHQIATTRLLREIPETKPGYVWNVGGRELKKETVDELEKKGREFSKKFGKDIVFITDERQLPKPDGNDTDALVNYNNQLRAAGWVHKGKVYINLPNVKDYNELETTIVHEVVGHHGLKEVFGRYLYDFIEDVYKTSDGTVKKGIEKMRNQYHGTDMYTATEEYLASLVEKAYPTAKERNLLVKFKDFIKSMLVRGDVYKSKYRRVSEDDLKSIMKAHYRYVVNRRNSETHRNDVFGRFKSSHLDKEVYSNPEAYSRKKKEMMQDEGYMKWTPEKFVDAKKQLNYPFLPPEVQEKVARKSGMSDEALREYIDAVNYRFEGKKGARNRRRLYPDEPGKSYEDAELYEQRGVAPWDIRKLTGWERGADGQWRKEVAENKGLLRDYVYDSLFETTPELAVEYKKIKEKPLSEWTMLDKRIWEDIVKEGKLENRKVELADVVTDRDFFVSYPDL